VEIYCDNTAINCADYGLRFTGSNAFPESSDDVDWWINIDHDDNNGTFGMLFDINATQRSTLDPQIKISIDGNSSNILTNINKPFTNGVYIPSVKYDGSSNLYRTKINVRPSSWLKYNRFFPDGRTFYHVEFNLQSDDWSGIGERGETVETNGSRKSNRRLEW
jgi:hypothetical protein